MNFRIRHGVKALVNNRNFALFFMINLALGLAGFMGIHTLSTSLDRHLNANLRELLTADLTLSASRPLTREELDLAGAILGETKRTARQVRFYTMVSGKTGSRLTQVIAVDSSFPLYGTMGFETPADQEGLQSAAEIAMTLDTARTYGIDPGDILSLGGKTFVFRHSVQTDPDRSLASFDLAPKIYMGLDQLQATGLVRFGSRVRYIHYYRLPDTVDVKSLKQALEARFEILSKGHPVISVSDSHDMSRGLERITRLFTGYLGLVSSVALFLAGIATAYLFRSYLDSQRPQIAIFMSIGAGHWDIFWMYTVQILILGSIASLGAILLSLFLVPAFPMLLKGLVPDNLTVTTRASTVIMALGMGMAGSLVFCLPVLVRLFGIKPLMLLRGSRSMPQVLSGRNLFRYLAFVPAVAGFLGLAVYLTDSPEKGLVFTLGLLGVMACLSLAGALVFNACNLLSRSGNPVRKIAFRNLYRNFIPSLACFVTIALGTFLISLIPQIQKGLQKELVRPDGLKIPVFFLVDIQEEQYRPLVDFMRNRKAVLANISPMVRGRILAVNGENFRERQKKAAGTEAGRQYRRLEFNFSFRRDLDDSETIVQGRRLSGTPWLPGSKIPFEISLAEEFSQWYGIAIDDTIDIDIQGMVFTGQVKNIRKVRWNSFQPNFFLLFQDGVLNDAPKTYLGSIAQVAPENRNDLRDSIARTFPNVSVIDVTQTVTTVLDIMDRLSLSIRFMAYLALGAGLVSIFSIARHEARNNQKQILLLKVLGTGFNDIRAIGLLEFGFMGFFASIAAICLSLLASWGISWYFFDRLWAFQWTSAVLIPLATTLTCMATSWSASRNTLKEKPALLLNAAS
ncbi:MAG: FtsX-like permease family protein [Pseudomonadota bacterium]